MVGAVGRDQHVDLRERRGEVALDQRADLLRRAVVRVVVAAGQGVGAQHDPALHLGAEAGLAGQAHDLLDRARAVVADPLAVAHAVELGQVARRLAGQDQVVGGQRVVEARAGDLDDLGTQLLQDRNGLGEALAHAGLVALAAELLHQADAHPGDVGALGGGRRRRARAACSEVESIGS